MDDVKFDKLEGRVRAMETRVAVQESNIETLVTNQNKIMDNTDWIRRTVTQAVIVGAVSLVVTIVGGVFFFLTKLS